MIIQWFPGHMSKALRKMEESVRKVDCLLYVLDARAPFSCINPQFASLLGQRSVVYVINKIDTVAPEDVRAWQRFFEGRGDTVVCTNSALGKESAKVLSALYEVNRDKIERYRQKGARYDVKAMVIGMPNTGKSTLINSLAKGRRTVTGDRPGVTRGEQWIRLDNGVVLLDTPGTLCHSIEVEDTAFNLAYIGCIRDAILDTEELAVQFAGKMSKEYPALLQARYKIEIGDKTPLEVFEAIASARGFLLKMGEVDYSRTAASLLDDFRKGRLGKIILERP